ncbi:hypothetical protein [Rubritalea tangerina]|uniref:hypothetical protein n=1 Tax=Rubritalea tangerina TaxID=430798 RepID=UPI00361F6CE1
MSSHETSTGIAIRSLPININIFIALSHLQVHFLHLHHNKTDTNGTDLSGFSVF